MRNDFTGGQPGIAHDTAQSGVGMDPAELAVGNGEVELGGTRLKQDHVAGADRRARIAKTQSRWIGQPLCQIAQPQRIARWQRNRSAAAGHRGTKQADAVEPGRRIAAVQAEPGSDEGLSFSGQTRRGHWLGTG